MTPLCIYLPVASTTKKSFSFWDFIGFGLIKSSDAVRGVKSFVSPQSGGCNTQDTVYLRSVKEIVYYSSLTDGVAGGAMAAAPSNSAVKSLGLGTIIASVGKLAVEIHMAQSIAQLAGLDPFDESVRAMVYLALAADSPSSDYALTARDIFKVKSRGIASKVSMEALRFLERETALVLITKGTGRIIGQGAFPSMPVVRNIFAFSRDVLNMNSVGDVLKYVFCPGQNSEPLSVEDDNLESPSDHDRNGAAEDVSINENHDGAVEDEEADEHDKNESYVEQTAGDNRPLGGGQKAFNTPQGVNQVEQQKAAGEQKRQDL
ncbi:hypothetical protein BC939DRAFT_449348 [Gamsiella multidivaricata]|uniref:uncharacterized protein n=1 Tax=Gamsiella multidivaricata TaxID=101098 RepID=UPI00221FB6D2|nr:uncharacterized protein BC939DRAFT_449348 [Gamsiella multidivaricata]KAI7824834.1 hypothetical protein BC939DRAFT_449348 [Gamsiella multidivaricata]